MATENVTKNMRPPFVALILFYLLSQVSLASNLSDHSLVVEKARLSPNVREWIRNAELMFCSISTPTVPLPITNALLNMNEEDFPVFIKKYIVSLSTQVTEKKIEAENLNVKIAQLKNNVGKINLPEIAKRMGADFKWHNYSSLIFFDLKTASNKTPELENFLELYGKEEGQLRPRKVWRGRGFKVKAYYEYDLDVATLKEAESRFSEMTIKISELESVYWKSVYDLRILELLKKEIGPDTSFKDAYLTLESMTLYIDRDNTSIFIVENPVELLKNNTQPISAIQICAQKTVLSQEKAPLFFTMTKDECEKYFNDIRLRLTHLAIKTMSERTAINISKSEIREGLEMAKKEIEEYTSKLLAAGNLEPEAEKHTHEMLEDSYSRYSRELNAKAPLNIEQIHSLVRKSTFEFAATEGRMGLEIYPILRNIVPNAPNSHPNRFHYTGNVRFLSTNPIIIIDYRLVDIDKFRAMLATSSSEASYSDAGVRNVFNSSIGLPPGFLSSYVVWGSFYSSDKESFCARLD